MVLRGRTHVTRKGQITVPVAIRKALGLAEGDPLDVRFDEKTHALTLERPHSVVDRTYGILHREGVQYSPAEEKRDRRAAAATAALARDERSKRGR
jgi:AbrB family looped-hinge helix DNA binding protein